MENFKFEPKDWVLVRDEEDEFWVLAQYAYLRGKDIAPYKYCIVGRSIGFKHCIPYNDETKHLLGTSNPYIASSPPHEYVRGEKVEVLWKGNWEEGIFILDDGAKELPILALRKNEEHIFYYERYEIRPIGTK